MLLKRKSHASWALENLLGKVFAGWRVVAPAGTDRHGANWICRNGRGDEKIHRAYMLKRLAKREQEILGSIAW